VQIAPGIGSLVGASHALAQAGDLAAGCARLEGTKLPTTNPIGRAQTSAGIAPAR